MAVATCTERPNFLGSKASARTATAVFLALLHAAVAGEKTAFAKRGVQVGAYLVQRASDPEHDRARLTGRPPARHLDDDVELPEHPRGLKRRQHGRTVALNPEEGLQITVVDLDHAGSTAKPNPGNRRLASPCGTNHGAFVNHNLSCHSFECGPSSGRGGLFRLLGRMRVVRAGVELELLQHLVAERPLRKHSPHGKVQDPFGMLLHHRAEGDTFES